MSVKVSLSGHLRMVQAQLLRDPHGERQLSEIRIGHYTNGGVCGVHLSVQYYPIG